MFLKHAYARYLLYDHGQPLARARGAALWRPTSRS